jgi:hypothetical protein
VTIHQIQIRHDEAEDRLLLRLSTTDNCEFRFWLTRRFTQRLWTILVQMLEWDEAVRQQLNPETRHAVVELQHEGYSSQADFATRFAEPAADAPRRLLLGEAPVLLATVKANKHGKGLQMLSLLPLKGQGVDISLDTKLLHIFTRLLREQVSKTDWELNLALHEGAQQSTQAQDREPQRRTLN